MESGFAATHLHTLFVCRAIAVPLSAVMEFAATHLHTLFVRRAIILPLSAVMQVI